ncbi:MAG: hypothetical protein WDA11_03650 [Thiohalomonadaceae bacterium]
MLEYIFFHESLRDRFVDFLRVRGVEALLSEADGLMVAVPDDLDDELSKVIEHEYDVLLQEHTEVMEDILEKDVAGVRVVLGNGAPATIRFDPDLLARVLQSISMEELRDMVQTIAEQVEHPDDRPLCHT